MEDEKEKGAGKGKDGKGKRSKQEAWNDKLHDNIRQRKWKDEPLPNGRRTTAKVPSQGLGGLNSSD